MFFQNLILSKGENKLDEVVINIEKPLIERKVDRLVFNVNNSAMVLGGDAIDVLKVTPNVQILNDKIYLIGKSSVKIMIDDRKIQMSGEDLTNFLTSIPSDMISKIEIITAPPAKYDADGNGGLINIIMNKIDKKDSFAATIRTTYRQSFYTTGRIGGNLSTQYGKWNTSSSINYLKGSYKVLEKHTTYYPLQVWNQNNRRREFRDQLSGRVSIENQITDKSSFGFIYSGLLDNPSNIEKDNVLIKTNTGNPTDFFSTTNATNNKTKDSHAFNLNYKLKLDSLNKFISFDFSHFIFNKVTTRKFDAVSYIDNNNNNLSSLNNGSLNVKITTANIDIELPFKKVKFLIGSKYSFIKNLSDFDFFDISLGNQKNTFKYEERIQAAYISAEKKVSNWNFQLGIRVENTETKGISTKPHKLNRNKYFKIFPTAYVLYKQNKNNVFSLNYSKRIGRPSYYMLDPFRVFQNQFSYIEGNPLILPEFIDSFELSYTYKNNLNTKFSFIYLEDGKSQFAIIDPQTNIKRYTYDNFFDMYSYNFQLSYMFKKIKWLKIYNSISYNHKTTNVFDNSFSSNIKQSSFSYYMNNSFNLNSSKSFLAEGSFYYRTPKNINVLNLKSVYYIDIGVKYLLFDKNLQLAIKLSDIFKSNRFRASIISNNIISFNDNYYDNQYLRFTILYKFGNKKNKNNHHKTGNKEEINRVF